MKKQAEANNKTQQEYKQSLKTKASMSIIKLHLLIVTSNENGLNSLVKSLRVTKKIIKQNLSILCL